MFAFFAVFVLFSVSFGVAAQETQTRVVDEVVAQVNDGVITLSRIKREKKAIVDGMIQEGKKREEAQALVDAKQGELIASLINEELLMQRAKEGGYDSDIDAQINRRFANIMKENNLKTIEELYAAMEKTGINPKDVRENWRKQMVRDLVLQRDLQSKVYWEPSPKQLKEYYEKHKEKFTKQETVSFSELFLGFAGRDEAAVRERAKLLYSLLRNGSDFDKIVKGVVLEDGEIQVDSLAYADAKDKSIIGIELHSGRNRIVRRIFEHLGYDVKGLDRVMYANLTKKNVERGKWRFLSEKEIRLLKYMNASKKR